MASTMIEMVFKPLGLGVVCIHSNRAGGSGWSLLIAGVPDLWNPLLPPPLSLLSWCQLPLLQVWSHFSASDSPTYPFKGTTQTPPSDNTFIGILIEFGTCLIARPQSHMSC